MPHLVVTTPEGLTLERPLAGAGSRFGAALLDVLLLLFSLVAIAGTLAIAAQFDPSGASSFLLGILMGGGLLAVLAYFALLPMRWQGQTPGKRVFGLRTLSADGWPARPGQHLLRALVWPLDVLLPVPTPFGLLGLVLIQVSGRRQRLGDLVAGTVVVREESRAAAFGNPTDAREIPSRTVNLDLHPGLLARLDDADRAFLGDLLGRRGMDSERRRQLFVEAARHYAVRLDLGPFVDAREVLAELCAFARQARPQA